MLPAFEHFMAPRLNYRQCTKFGTPEIIRSCQAAIRALVFYVDNCREPSQNSKKELFDIDLLQNEELISIKGEQTSSSFERLSEWLEHYVASLGNETEFTAFLYNAFLSADEPYSYLVPEAAFKDALYPQAPLEISFLKTAEGEEISTIKIPSFFGEGLTQQFADLLQQLEGSGVKKMLIDLRGNPGGELQLASEMLSLLLEDVDQFPIFIEKDFGDNAESKQVFAKASKVLYSGEILVLVDGGTASAAEIFAAAISDHRRGILIGEKTYGKGVQQLAQVLDEENPNGRVLLVYKDKLLLRSNGQSYNLVGIEPSQSFKQWGLLIP